MSTSSDDKTRIYPLRDVVAVVEFPIEPSVECLRHEFFNRIRDRFSEVSLPMGGDVALKPYRFETPDQTEAVFLGSNTLAFATAKYEGYETFRETFLYLVKLLESTFKVSSFTEISLLYTNIFPYDSSRSAIPLKQFVKMGIALPKGVSTDFINFDLQFTVPSGSGQIEISAQPGFREQPEYSEAIFLTLKYNAAIDFQASEVVQCLDEAHERTTELFKSLINKTYWKSLEKKE